MMINLTITRDEAVLLSTKFRPVWNRLNNEAASCSIRRSDRTYHRITQDLALEVLQATGGSVTFPTDTV